MDFDFFIKELHGVSGLEEVRPDEGGVYSLRVNHTHLVYFSESFDKQNLYLYAPLCPIPSDPKEKLALYDQLLNANLFGRESSNGWFASDNRSYEIFLIVKIPCELLTLGLFTTELQQFIACLSYWKSHLSEVSFKQQESPSLNVITSYIKP